MKNVMLGLRAETSIHAGTGQNNGVIDMPIQREVHTGYPCVFGSAVKGAFRAHADVRADWGKEDLKNTFGTVDNEGSASQISMTDARLLLLPVRSLTGHFKLVTCPAILDRLRRDMDMMCIKVNWTVPKVLQGQLLSHQQSGNIFLEEFKFEQKQGLSDSLLNALQSFGTDNLEGQLVVMNDADFAWFAKNATAVTPHIAINSATKIVKTGALWYEETLPSDSLLYTMLMGSDKYVQSVMDLFSEDKPFIQIGGNETVGMGWCHVTTVKT